MSVQDSYDDAEIHFVLISGTNISGDITYSFNESGQGVVADNEKNVEEVVYVLNSHIRLPRHLLSERAQGNP